MAIELPPLVGRVIFTTAAAQGEIDSYKVQMAEFAASNDAAMAGVTAKTEEMSAGVAGAISTTEGELGALAPELKGTDAQVGFLAAAFDRLRLSVAGVVEELPVLGPALAEADVSMTETEGAAAATEGAMGGLQTVVIGFGALAGAAIIDFALKAGEALQNAQAHIAATAQISTSAAAQITTGFIAMMGSTIYSADELGNAYASVAGELGTLAGKALNATQAVAFMTTAQNLAEASGVKLTAAVTALAGTMRAYSINLKTSQKVSDDLFNTSTKLAVSITSVASTISKMKTKMGDMAPSLQDTSALMLDLHAHGESGRAAVSAVGSALQNLSTTKAKAELKTLGVKITDAKGKFIGIRTTISQLAPALKNLSETTRKAALSALFGASAAQKLLTTILAGPATFDKYKKSVEAKGAADAAAEKQAKTFGHQMEEIKVTVKDLAEKFGSMLLPKLEIVLHWINTGTSWLARHKDAMEALTIAMALLAIGIGLVIAVIALPFITAFAAAALIVYGLIKAFDFVKDHLVKTWDTVRHDVAHYWGDIVSFFHRVWSDITNAIHSAWSAVINFFTSTWATITSGVHSAWSAIINFFSSIPGEIMNALASLGTDLITLADQAWNGFYTAAEVVVYNMLVWASGIGNDILHWIGDIGNILYNIGHAIIEGLWNGLKAAWHDVTGWLGSIGGVIKGLKGPIEKDAVLLVPHGKAIMHGLAAGLKSGFQTHAIPTLVAAAKAIQGAFTDNTFGLNAYGHMSLPKVPIGAGGSHASGGTITIQIPVVLTGKKIATATVTNIRELLLRGKGRQTQNTFGGGAGRLLPTGA